MTEQFTENWTEIDAKNAEAQGWNLFLNVSEKELGSETLVGELQLQRVDALLYFPSDAEAWSFVKDQARLGDETCLRALHRLAHENNAEYFRVMKGA